jgi:hypothetical protein
MINGVLVIRPAKIQKELRVIELQEYARSGKSGSVSALGINKVKVIVGFLNGKHESHFQ